METRVTYKQLVEQILTENKATRDDDVLLFEKVLSHLGFNATIKAVSSYIRAVNMKELPNYDTITRLRRKLQQDDERLRGPLWLERHTHKVNRALSDLGYAQR
jgi:hypothetical protein